MTKSALQAAATLRRRDLAMIHIAVKDLKLDDDAYRDLLAQLTGKRSSADLTPTERKRVLRRFAELGWQAKPAAVATPRPTSEDKQVRMIWAIWREMCAAGIPDNPTDAGLRAFCRRMTECDDPAWATVRKRRVLIEALKSWRTRGMEAGAGS